MIKCFLPLDGVGGNPLPKNVEEYRRYRDGVVALVEARKNQRMLDSVGSTEGQRMMVEVV